jgi:hypothetical protein
MTSIASDQLEDLTVSKYKISLSFQQSSRLLSQFVTLGLTSDYYIDVETPIPSLNSLLSESTMVSACETERL